ncbi:hypothetical protein IB211_01894c [Intestinimonas butyriciproducens]|uniref:DUF454 domain-containing protein n=2 Tax=Intestinimonas butyriciproducens TaxID=1297617 RepID=A0A0S2W4K3_9FIRM|nr:hypothetical protein IB211_01894c [Intestinimonas butyriciproducens]
MINMRIIFIVLGFLSLGLGCIGVALPILPTTPFLLVSAFCFARSSERLNTWFRGTKLYKNNLETFVLGQGMPWRAKLRIMGTVTVIMAIAFIAMRSTVIGRTCLVAVWVAHVIAFCLIIKTCPAERANSREVTCHDDQ